MSLEAFVAQNLVWIMTCVFGAGGLWVLVRAMGKRLDAHESRIEAKFDELTRRDLAHDARIGALEAAHGKLEERVNGLSGWMKDMRDKIDRIYDKLMGS